MSDTHKVAVVRVGAIKPHPNADKLELTEVGGYQVVIGKDSFKEGDLAVYIQPDSVVPQTEPFKFIWGPYVEGELPSDPGVRAQAEARGAARGVIVPERRRRITVKRLRKEYSEGLLMPVSDFNSGANFDGQWKQVGDVVAFRNTVGGITSVPIGNDVADLLGVTHYVPEFDRESTSANTQAMPKRKYPKTLRGWFFWALYKLGIKGAAKSYAQEVSFVLPVYDIDALKNHKNWFNESDIVQVTEKIHGSNARFTFIPDNENDPLSDGKFYVGSHDQWKQDGPNVWWNATRQFPQIEDWCTQNPRKVLYGEVGPTQKGFRYGAEEGETFFYAFDVFDPKTGNWTWAGNEGFAPTVPILYVGAYDADTLKKYVDGDSVIPQAKNIREGVVVRRLSDNRKLKLVSNLYLEKESK